MNGGEAKTVLIVDEDLVFQELMEIYLRNEGYLVRSVPDGVDAVAPLEGGEIGAVILELMLPLLDGMRLLKWMMTFREPPPVLVVTAAGEESARREAMAAGASEFFHKPVHADRILRWLDKTLGRGGMDG